MTPLSGSPPEGDRRSPPAGRSSRRQAAGRVRVPVAVHPARVTHSGSAVATLTAPLHHPKLHEFQGENLPWTTSVSGTSSSRSSGSCCCSPGSCCCSGSWPTSSGTTRSADGARPAGSSSSSSSPGWAS